jgi:hypothetical protein
VPVRPSDEDIDDLSGSIVGTCTFTSRRCPARSDSNGLVGTSAVIGMPGADFCSSCHNP